MLDFDKGSFSRNFINNIQYFSKKCATAAGRDKTLMTSSCFYCFSSFGLQDFVVLNISDIPGGPN